MAWGVPPQGPPHLRKLTVGGRNSRALSGPSPVMLATPHTVWSLELGHLHNCWHEMRARQLGVGCWEA